MPELEWSFPPLIVLPLVVLAAGYALGTPRIWRRSGVWHGVRRLDVAAALVDASEKSYGSTLESYRRGLETLTNLLAARRELSRARFVDLDTRVQLLNASAALAFSTGAPTGP